MPDPTTDPDRPGPVGRPDASDRDRLVTLAEAAILSGLSSEAIRLRIRRKTLWSTRRNDGRTVVRARDLTDLPPARPVASDRSSMDEQPGLSRLLDRLETLEVEAREARQLTAEYIALLGDAKEKIARTEAERAAAEARVTTVEAEAREARRLADHRAEEVAGLRERIGRVEADRRAAETAADRAERRQDAAEAALREARLPWQERLARVVQAFRRGG